MNRRGHLVAILISAGVAIALLVAVNWPASSEPAAAAGDTGLTTVAAAADREAAARLARMAPAPVRERVGKFSAETIQATEDKFRRMVAVRGLVTQDKERSTLAQQVLATSDGDQADGAHLMRAILLDPAFARTAFGEFQAEARYYAIAVLDEMARQGHLDFVVEAAADLGEQLAAVSGEIDQGRAEDLRGVSIIIGRSLGSRGVSDPKSPVLARLGFPSGVAKPVRDIYIEGMFYGVWKAESIEQAMAAVKML